MPTNKSIGKEINLNPNYALCVVLVCSVASVVSNSL